MTTELSDGDVLNAAKANEIIRDGIDKVTSATRPTGYEGRVIYETDTDTYYMYDGSSWVAFWKGWTNVTTGATAATNWTVTDYNAWYNHEALQFRLTVARSTSSLSVGSTGDIANTLVATLPTSCRGDINLDLAVGSGHAGRVAAGFYNPSTGEVYVSAVGGSGDIAIGHSISLGGYVLLNA